MPTKLEKLEALIQDAYELPWHAQENDTCWELYGAAPVIDGYEGHPLKILKAPKHSTPYTEYWPRAQEAALIVEAVNALPELLQELKELRGALSALEPEPKSAVQKARIAIAEAFAELREIRSNREIACRCGKKHKIKDLKLIVMHDYEEPYGCTGGDRWTEGEWQFYCPDCKLRNRLAFNDYDVEYEKRRTVDIAAEATFKALYRAMFASIENVRSRQATGGVLNYYVDNNREEFELPAKPKK